MKPALLAAAVLAALAASSAADDGDKDKTDKSSKPFKASFIGEGGGYKQPDQATDQYLQGGLAPGGVAPARALPTAAPAERLKEAGPDRRPPAAPPAPAASVPAEGFAAKADAPRAAARRAPDAAKPASAAPVQAAKAPGSLWNGLVKPLDMPSAAAADADPAAARAESDRDYETHVLGMAAGPARPALGEPAGAPGVTGVPAASIAATAPGKVFVSLELDPKEAGSLRDAVAGLGAAAGFSADARFEMQAAPGGRTLVAGWLPASRLADALSRPGVKRVSVEPRPRPTPAQETRSSYLVGLRLDDPARARQGVDDGVRALTGAAGFRLARVVGLETAPDGRSVAVVTGELPVGRLAKAMSLPQVAKILPLIDAPSAAPAAAPAPASVAGFGRFALKHGWWLIALTLLLALPGIREPLARAGAVFNPYR